MIRVDVLTREREADYSAFVRREPRGTIYATVEFREFLRQAVGGEPRYYIAVDERHRIVGGLPSFHMSRHGVGRVINSLPWFGSHGACVTALEAPPGVREALLSRFAQEMSAPEVLTATVVVPPNEDVNRSVYAQALGSGSMVVRLNQLTHLPSAETPDLEPQLERILSKKTRNLVRKACKQGFEHSIEDSDDAWRFLHETHAENMEGLGGQAKPWTHFVAMRATIPPGWRHLAVARLNGAPVAAMLTFVFNQTVEYITPVIKHEFRSLQPLSFLIWNGMLTATRQGSRFWNWGGTWPTQTTLHHFKAGWGATDQPYSYHVHAKPEALEALRRDRLSVMKAFPFYFVYPFESL